MADNTTTTNLPLDVYKAHGAVIEAVKVKYPKAHYLEQLTRNVGCTFVKIFDSSSALQAHAQKQGYLGLVGVVHLTETWSKLLEKPVSAAALQMLSKSATPVKRKTCTLEQGLQDNPKDVFLSKDKIDVAAVAHEFFHWLNHPNWGKVFDPVPWVTEGAAEGLMRYVLDDKYQNNVYNGEVDKVKVKFKEIGVLMSAYFNGDLTALKTLVDASEDAEAAKRLQLLTK